MLDVDAESVVPVSRGLTAVSELNAYHAGLQVVGGSEQMLVTPRVIPVTHQLGESYL